MSEKFRECDLFKGRVSLRECDHNVFVSKIFMWEDSVGKTNQAKK